MEDTYSTPPCCLRNHFAILLLREKKTIFNFNFEVNISWKKFVQNSWFNVIYFIKFPFNNCGSDLGWSYTFITVFYFLHWSNIVHLLESCRSCQNPVISNIEERHKSQGRITSKKYVLRQIVPLKLKHFYVQVATEALLLFTNIDIKYAINAINMKRRWVRESTSSSLLRSCILRRGEVANWQCAGQFREDSNGASLIMNGSWELSADALQLHIRRWSLESWVTEFIL